MNIDELKYNFDQGARGNRYDVQFVLPVSFGTEAVAEVQEVKDDEGNVTTKGVEGKPAENGNPRTMGLRVESCTLPGRSLGTTSWSEYGQERQMPDGSVDDGGTVDFTFICDQSFGDRLIIEGWQQTIFANPSTNGVQGTADMPKMSFYDDYIGKVHIIQHRSDRKDSEDTKRNALKYTLHEAYPVEFSDMSLGQTETGIMRFQCTLAYRFWESEYIPAPERSLLNKGRGLLDALLGGSNLLSRFGKEGKLRKTLTNLDTRTSQISNIFGGG
tara:strand:+ start:6277 stop:7092 length:816 start_codon:yes stop_codon:yes gene_type:complete